MRTLDQLIANIHLLIAVAAIGLLWFQWKTFRIDAVRQQLFELRGELFDYASGGEIDFNHLAYKMLRMRLNGTIQFAHRVSFARLIMSIIFFHSTQPEFVTKRVHKWNEALGAASPQARRKLKEFDSKLSVVLVQQMVTRSPILMLVFGIFVTLAAFSVVVMKFWEKVTKFVPGMDLLEAQTLQTNQS